MHYLLSLSLFYLIFSLEKKLFLSIGWFLSFFHIVCYCLRQLLFTISSFLSFLLSASNVYALRLHGGCIIPGTCGIKEAGQLFFYTAVRVHIMNCCTKCISYDHSFFYSVSSFCRLGLSIGCPELEFLGQIALEFSVKSLRSSAVFGGRLQRPSPCLIRSEPRRERVWMLSETSEKRTKMYFERYYPVILRILI